MSNLVALDGNDSFNATLERNDVSIIGFGPTPIYQIPPILNQSPSTIQKPMNLNPNNIYQSTRNIAKVRSENGI